MFAFLRACVRACVPYAECLSRFSTTAEVVKRANDTDYGLAAGVCTKDIALAMAVAG